MPFTFSHPAIVLPLMLLSKRYFSLTGLVVGSMAPDFEYFLKMKAGSDISHTLLGILLFNLPVGLTLCFIFHLTVRNVLIDHLPHFFRIRFNRFKSFNWMLYFGKNYFVVFISIILGAISHLLWDNFTHDGCYFVKLIPLLQTNIYGDFPVYRVMQHLSTIVGALMILVAIQRMPKTIDENKGCNIQYWTIIAACILFAVGLRIISGTSIYSYAHIIVSSISGLWIGLIAASVVYKINGLKHRK